MASSAKISVSLRPTSAIGYPSDEESESGGDDEAGSERQGKKSLEAAKHPFSEPWGGSDLIFVVEEERFHVHRLIMSMHSPVFEAMLNSVGFKEATATEIPLPGKKANEFLDFLELLYMKKIDEVQPQFSGYLKTLKEREQRIKKGTNEEHKEKCKRNRRLLNKLERRCSSFEFIKETMSPRERQLTTEILYIDYMSSEESEYEDQEDNITGEKERKLVAYAKRKFSWERSNLTSIKAKLDKVHNNNLTPHARAQVRTD